MMYDVQELAKNYMRTRPKVSMHYVVPSTNQQSNFCHVIKMAPICPHSLAAFHNFYLNTVTINRKIFSMMQVRTMTSILYIFL